MSKKIRINVTQKDIDAGEIGNPCGCPIALACRRNKNLPEATVGHVSISSPFFQVISLPAKARIFVEDFDYEKVVKPFSFTVTKN